MGPETPPNQSVAVYEYADQEPFLVFVVIVGTRA